MSGGPADIARFRQALREVREESGALLDGLTSEQLGWRPAPDAWSLGEVAIHLRTVNDLYIPRIRRAIGQAEMSGRSAAEPYRPTLVGGWMVRSMSSPRRLPSPRRFRPARLPAGSPDWAEELRGYRSTHEALAALLDDAAGVSLNAPRIASPAMRLIRMNLGDAIALWLAHERRHLEQMRRVRASPGFPP